MNFTAKARIKNEIYSVNSKKVKDYVILTKDDDIKNLIVELNGAINTPYEGGIYYFSITLPMNYPFESPKVKLYLLNNKNFIGFLCFRRRISS
jgi:ubiquitin-protein ligase